MAARRNVNGRGRRKTKRRGENAQRSTIRKRESPLNSARCQLSAGRRRKTTERRRDEERRNGEKKRTQTSRTRRSKVTVLMLTNIPAGKTTPNRRRRRKTDAENAQLSFGNLRGIRSVRELQPGGKRQRKSHKQRGRK